MSDCICTMGTIEANCDAINAAGLDRVLHTTCQDELLSIPAPEAGTHKVTANITYRAPVVGPPAVAAGKFHRWYFASEDQEWSCEQDEASGLWKTEFKIFIPKLADTKTYVLKGVGGGENKVIVVQDKNGKKRIVGDLINGAKLKVREQVSPKNGYVVTGMWESAEPPLFYEGTLTV